MKKFIIRLIQFLSLILLIVLPVGVILFLSGENFRDLDSILNSDRQRLIGYAYNEDNYKFIKWYELNNKPRFSVVAIGSSRVLQFRREMFQSSFYNAGYTINTIGDFKPFLEGISKNKHPDYIIIGLDQWMFNSNWDNLELIKPKSYWQESYTYFPGSNSVKEIYMDLLKGKISPFSNYNLSSPKYIGLNAIVNNKGMRNDGSMFYGNQIELLLANSEDVNDYKFTGTINRIDKGMSRFQYTDQVNLKAISEVGKLLEYCSKNKINVIGFLPPFPEKIYQYMLTTDKYFYINNNQLFKSLKPLFQNYNFEIFDYTHGLDLGVNFNEDEFIDGFHGGESIYAKILLDMSNKSFLLKNKIDKNLELKLENRKNRYQLQ